MVVTRYKGRKIIGKKVADVFRQIYDLIEIERKEAILNAYSKGEKTEDGQVGGNETPVNQQVK